MLGSILQVYIFDYIPATTMAVVIMFLLYSLTVKKITVFSIALFTTFSIELLHQVFELYFRQYFNAETYYPLVSFGWYFSFAITDILAVIVMYKLLKLFQLNANWLIKCMSVVYIYIAAVQVLGYVCRFMLGVDTFGVVYKNSVHIVNIVIPGLLIWYFIGEVIENRRGRQRESELY